jgi:AraC family transcriptional activator of mtrCDE
MMTALMNQCLILVLRRVSEESDGGLPWLSALEDPRLERVMETILKHPERRHTVESLADVSNMSRSTFARHFEQCFGRSPMDYVRDVRLRRAARLLHLGDLSVDGVAAKVGFASRSHFSRAFQLQFGCPPAQFRKQNS